MSKKESRYQKSFTTFSGADIIPVIQTEGGKAIVIGDIQTLSYSVFRPTAPVFALGRIGAKGVVRGARTIAGTLIFTVFDRHVLYEVFQQVNADGKKNAQKSDELPPFDITINFLNENGQSAQMVIYGVHLISEGQTMSIEDMITENTMEFVAVDIDIMQPNIAESI